MSQHDDAHLERFLKGESAISELYKRAGQDGPPVALDQKILAQAQQAVDEDLAPPLRRQRPEWLVPLSVAATVVLGINLAFNLRDFQQDAVYYESDGIIYSDRTRPPSRQSPPHTVQSPLAKSPAASTPADSQNLSRADISRRTVEEPQAPQTGPDRLRVAKPEMNDQRLRAIAPASKAPERQPLRDNATSGVAAAPDNADDSSAFAPPPLMEGSRQMSRESAARLEEEVARMPGLKRRIATTAPDAGIRQAGEADAANELKTDVSQGRLGRLRSAPQATTVAGSSASENQSVTALKHPAALTDFDSDRNNDAAEAVDRADETGGPRPADHGSPLAAPPEAYLCDLKKLHITREAITTARRDALSAAPPLTMRTWIVEIQRLADEEAYVDACRHLAAYIETFGRSRATDDLSVRLPE